MAYDLQCHMPKPVQKFEQCSALIVLPNLFVLHCFGHFTMTQKGFFVCVTYFKGQKSLDNFLEALGDHWAINALKIQVRRNSLQKLCTTSKNVRIRTHLNSHFSLWGKRSNTKAQYKYYKNFFLLQKSAQSPLQNAGKSVHFVTRLSTVTSVGSTKSEQDT